MINKIDFKLNGFEVCMGYERTYIDNKSEINYSDGQIEDEIFFVLNNLVDFKDNKYQYLENEIKNWPTKYHFAWERQNILRTIEFKSNDRVLELGGGTGVLTDYIAENVSYVCSIEGTFSRGRCIEKRCFEYKNIDVLIADFLKLDLISLFSGVKFDKIVLVGVLEYVSKYSNMEADEAINILLNVCRELLEYDGELIIAIENKLGLKYFLGWKEDHNGQQYYSVESKYKFKDDFATFSKKELEKKLEKANFKTINFSYPFPDYKLPSVIINDWEYIYGKEFKQLINNLLYDIKIPDYSLDNTISNVNNIKFGRVLKNIIEEELLGETSNSFLIVACKEIKESNKSIFARYFSVQRRYEFANQIVFVNNSNKILVNKKWFFDFKNKNEKILSLNSSSNKIVDYVGGESLHMKLDNLFYLNNKLEYLSLLGRWIELLRNDIVNCKDNFDVIPQNAIYTENNMIKLIDFDEWSVENKLSNAQLLYRYFVLNSVHLSWLYPENCGFKDQFLQLLNDFKVEFNEWADFEIIDNIHDFSNSNIMRKSYSITPIVINKSVKEITVREAFEVIFKKCKRKLLKR